MGKVYLSIIIPVYNEAKRIRGTLLSIRDYLSRQDYAYEIIVVNDGSGDTTSQIILDLKGKIKTLKLIDNKNNYGKGCVVRQGLLQAKGEYRLFTDADNSTQITELENFLPYLEKGYDIIIGSRAISGSKIVKAQPFHRKVLGKVYSILSHLITGLHDVVDTQCGFKLFSEKSVKDILPRCKVNGWSFDSEILIIAQKLGYKIKETPITWTNESNTKVKFFGMVKSILDLLKIRYNIIFKSYGKRRLFRNI